MIKRHYTTPGHNPFDQIKWEQRDVELKNTDGEVIFERKDIQVPASWSQTALNVVVSKYFRGHETSVKQLIERVVRTISQWAVKDRYMIEDEAEVLEDELVYLLLHQYMSFNSPVWFNVGVEEYPQCSACFINSVDDTMESILELCKTEGKLFKHGSGSGTNLSSIRGSQERLSGGGQASGPISFMRGYDAFAGAIKSGGKTRRAAKMAIFDIDHPDIELFINCKMKEERKAQILIDAGYDGSIDGEAYGSVAFQNANNSVRLTDEFMYAVEKDQIWKTVNRVDGSIAGSYEARALMHQIANAAHTCGDPGLQFDTTINAWHTCAKDGRINASNPCSEFMFLDDSACNLASLNLMKFRDPQKGNDNNDPSNKGNGGEFDVEGFKHAVDVIITAQEILIDNASYPTKKIEENSRKYRPLGLGYANLGALLMSWGLPYDSDAGRAYAAVITAIMTGEAYAQSARIAAVKGNFEGYRKNKEIMMRVIHQHTEKVKTLNRAHVPLLLVQAARSVWADAYRFVGSHGFRNAQVTVLAPTGTIGFMMDCDTTGIEPDLALVKYKKLVGGGTIKSVNTAVNRALEKLDYCYGTKKLILEYLENEETLEGAPYLTKEDLAVFDCAIKPLKGKRSIDPMGHVRMMAAVQPFLSGAISKTVNVPNETTIEEIESLYVEAWKLGLKSIAIYRDGCKRSQPLTTGEDQKMIEEAKYPKQGGPVKEIPVFPQRCRLPNERQALTHKFSIGGHEGYITVGLYEDGSPGEIFITMSKEGSTISGLMDSLATSISLALQYGVPLDILIAKFSHMRYEPSGFTGNKEIPIAKSITDYLFRWLGLRFAKKIKSPESYLIKGNQTDAPSCAECGNIMTRNGSCYKCTNCGSTSGCS